MATLAAWSAIAVAIALGVLAAPGMAADSGEAFAVLVARQPNGPSFDCKLPHLSAIERDICTDRRLARLDLQLNDAYGEVALDSSDSIGVITAQESWLRFRNVCTTNACLRNAYATRLTALQQEATQEQRQREPRDAPFHAPPALTSSLTKLAGTCVKVDGKVDVGDGRESLLVYACNQCASNGGFFIFHPEAGTYRILLHGDQCYVSDLFEGFQTPRSHGFRRIETFTRDAAGEHHLDFYDYDGRTYRQGLELDQIIVDGNHEIVTLTRP
jgi:uncharacterized protein YecT (DUF1311 family)